MTTYLPKCCMVRPDGAGRYEVAHTETDSYCKHNRSGGTGGFADGITPCNRIISHGITRGEAARGARDYLAGQARRAEMIAGLNINIRDF